jgi:hypothetical protein
MSISNTHSRYMVQLGLLPQDYVTLQAAESDIQKAFKIQALLHHPDRNYGCETDASEKFRVADEAREELMAALGGLNIESENEGEAESHDRSKRSRRNSQSDARRAPAFPLRDELLRAEAHRAARAAEATRQQNRAAARAQQAAHLQALSIARREAMVAQAAKAVQQRRAAEEACRREAVYREQQQRLAQQQRAEQRACAQQLGRANARERNLAWLAHQRAEAAAELAQHERQLLQNNIEESVWSQPSKKSSGVSKKRLGEQRAETDNTNVTSPSRICGLKRQATAPSYLELRARVGGRTVCL